MPFIVIEINSGEKNCDDCDYKRIIKNNLRSFPQCQIFDYYCGEKTEEIFRSNMERCERCKNAQKKYELKK